MTAPASRQHRSSAPHLFGRSALLCGKTLAPLLQRIVIVTACRLSPAHVLTSFCASSINMLFLCRCVKSKSCLCHFARACCKPGAQPRASTERRVSCSTPANRKAALCVAGGVLVAAWASAAATHVMKYNHQASAISSSARPEMRGMYAFAILFSTSLSTTHGWLLAQCAPMKWHTAGRVTPIVILPSITRILHGNDNKPNVVASAAGFFVAHRVSSLYAQAAFRGGLTYCYDIGC